MIKKILIVAGGTGGHIFPALAVADALSKQGVAIHWLGGEVGMEKNLVTPLYPITLLPIKALRGKNSFQKLLTPFRLIKSIYLACKLIYKINPDIVFGVGGYASGPGGIAAKIMRKKLIIHEQNAIPGLTNRVLAHFADKTLQAFSNTFSAKINATTTGNPVRESILNIVSPEIRYDNKKSSIHVLILGGSQGAQAINQLIPKINAENFSIWHQTGKNNTVDYVNSNCKIYKVEPFIENIAEAYAWADLVIARAGALTVSEIMAAGCASILIPYPLAVDHHQDANADILVKAYAAKKFDQATLTPEIITAEIKALISEPEVLKTMAINAKNQAVPDSVIKIVEIIEDTITH